MKLIPYWIEEGFFTSVSQPDSSFNTFSSDGYKHVVKTNAYTFEYNSNQIVFMRD